jgi:hypothetical protein
MGKRTRDNFSADPVATGLWPVSVSAPSDRLTLTVQRSMGFMRMIGRWAFLLLLWRDVLCRSIESCADNARFRGRKINIRVALPVPGAATWFENLGAFLINARCCSGVSFTMPQLSSGAQVTQNLSRDTEIGLIMCDRSTAVGISSAIFRNSATVISLVISI